MADGVGHFKNDRAHAHFVDCYRAAMAELPSYSRSFDISTTFGTVRVYRFDGPQGRPVVLLPGRNASTPMWRVNIAGLLAHRTVFCVDLLGEAGMSVQDEPITGPDDEAQWLDEALADLELDRVHLMGVSIGGWTATNCAARRPGRIASIALLDPVMTFARVSLKAVLASPALFLPGIPQALRRRVFRWIAGGAEVDDSLSETALLSAGSTDFVLRKAMPKPIADDQLRSLDIPVLALIAGRSVIHDAERAAANARKLLPRGHVELWPDASHAINGEFPDRIAGRAGLFWNDVDNPCRN